MSSAVVATHALSVRRPWAEAIRRGLKKGENRSWKPSSKKCRRVPFWIALHVSKTLVRRDDPALLREAEHTPQLVTWNRRDPDVCGKIVALVQIIGFEKPSDKPFCRSGPHVWVIGEVRELPEPVPCLGRLGLFALRTPLSV